MVQIYYHRFPLNTEGLSSASLDLQFPLIKFNKSGTRLLVVCDHCAPSALNSGKLDGSNPSEVLNNVIVAAQKDSEGTLAELLFVNFIELGRGSDNPRLLFERYTKRIANIAEKFHPDVIVSIGRQFNKALGWTDIRENLLNIGRLRPGYLLGKEYNCIETFPWHAWSWGPPEGIPFSFVGSCLLSLVVGHFSQAIVGKNRYTLPQTPPKHYTISTMEQWRKFYNLLIKSPEPSIDTETNNLNRIDNDLLTVQFCMNGVDCFCLPWHHRETPWSENEFRIIRQDLVDYFTNGKSRWQIYQNAQFDLCQLTVQLKIPFINHKIWDISAGLRELDENLKFWSEYDRKLFNRFKRAGSSLGPYSLIRMEHFYGLKRPIGLIDKEERGNMAAQSLQRISEYGCFDVFSPWHISHFEQQEAKRRGRLYSKYIPCVTNTIDNIIHAFVDMEKNGILIDKNYLVNMMKTNSVFNLEINNIQDSFKNSLPAQRVNKKLLGNKDIPEIDLLGNLSSWKFSINKSSHQQMLFYQEMGLEPAGLPGKNGLSPTDDKFKQKHIKVPEVKAFALYSHYRHMFDAFIVGIAKKLSNSADAKIDGRLRAFYNYLYIITGRTSCVAPNYQQIPSRSRSFDDIEPKLAKIIKRMFIAAEGCLLIKVDLSSHEVRCWGQVSGDRNIIKVFWEIWEIHRKFRLAKNKEEIEYLSKNLDDADLHVRNCLFFFSQKVNKKHPLRQNIKQVVFGVIYDLSAKKLAERINQTKEYAQNLIDTMFKRWSTGKKFIDDAKEFARNNLKVISPLGRVRHLYGFLHWYEALQSAMERRASNSIIQGMASDLGYMAARELRKVVWKINKSFNSIKLKSRHTNSVHDSGLHEVPYAEIPLMIYLIEHSMTTQLQKNCREIYNFVNKIPYECEIELGGSEGNMHEYNWRMENLIKTVSDIIDWQVTELKYTIDKATILKILQHNINIIYPIRLKELQAVKLGTPPEYCHVSEHPSCLSNYIFSA